MDAAVAGAVRDAEAAGVTGARLTPFLLGAVLAATDGRSLPANLALLEANAALAAQIAVAFAAAARHRGRPDRPQRTVCTRR